jgi:acetoacetate decarboxylase
MGLQRHETPRVPKVAKTSAMIITYRTDPAKLRSVVPAPLESDEREALVKYECPHAGI